MSAIEGGLFAAKVVSSIFYVVETTVWSHLKLKIKKKNTTVCNRKLECQYDR